MASNHQGRRQSDASGGKRSTRGLLSFAGDAYVNEMGNTNPLFPDEATMVCQPAQGITEPNNFDDINTFTTFMRLLKIPPRGPITAEVNQGQAIFEKIGYTDCHVEPMTTAPAG